MTLKRLRKAQRVRSAVASGEEDWTVARTWPSIEVESMTTMAQAFEDMILEMPKEETEPVEEDPKAKKGKKKETKKQKELIKRMKESLTGEVEDVKPSVRLTDSAAVLVLAEHDMGPQMRQIMEAAGQTMPVSKPILEVNTNHGLLKRLESEKDESRFRELARLVFDHAQLVAEGKLDDAPGYLKRVNALLTELSV